MRRNYLLDEEFCYKPVAKCLYNKAQLSLTTHVMLVPVSRRSCLNSEAFVYRKHFRFISYIVTYLTYLFFSIVYVCV